jgi:hypothetical protein
MRVEGLRNNAVGTIAITQVIMGRLEGRELLVGWNYPPCFCINYSFAAVCVIMLRSAILTAMPLGLDSSISL